MDFCLYPTIVEQIRQVLEQANSKIPFLRLIWPDKPVEEYSYQSLTARSVEWKDFYQRQGLRPGDRVIIILQHSFDLYASYLGAVIGGMIPSMFSFPSPKFSPEAFFATIDVLVKISEAKLLVTYQELAASLKVGLSPNTSADLQIVTSETVQLIPISPQEAIKYLPLEYVSRDDTAFLQFSSGTTGIKKGVSISHHALLSQLNTYSQAIKLSSQDVIVSWLPLYHDMGLIACYWLPILTGTPLVCMSPHDWVRKPVMLFESISRYSGTLCWLPNFSFNHLTKTVSTQPETALDLSSLRGVVNCSEPVLHESFEMFLQHFSKFGLRREALWSCYAMAESTFAVTAGGSPNPIFVDWVDSAKLRSEGKAIPVADRQSTSKPLISSGEILPDIQVRIIGANGEDQPERTIGEIALKAEFLASGYFNNTAATAAAFCDGWYYTGDLGYTVGQELVVTGRKKDLIIVAGNNIYPQDLEELVNRIPGIVPGRSVAFGDLDSDSGTDKLVILAEADDTSKAGELAREILRVLAAQADVAPSDIRIFERGWLLKSSSGKIARNANRDKYRALKLAASRPISTSNVIQQSTSEETVVARIRKVLHKIICNHDDITIDQLGERDALISSGIVDSLSIVMLMVDLENEFKLTIPDILQWDFQNFDSIEAIAELISSLQAPTKKSSTMTRLGDGDSEREWKCKWFIKGPRDFDTAILGSSRVMALATKTLNQYGFNSYNFAVNNARAEDWYCTFRFLLDNNKVQLRNVFLAIDIEGFTNGAEVDYRLLKCQALAKYLMAGDGQNANLPNLCGQDRATEILHNLRTQGSNLATYTYDTMRGDIVYLEDQELIEAFETRQPLLNRDMRLVAQKASYKTRLEGFSALHRRRLSYFALLIQECLQRKINLIAFFSPLHRELERFLCSETYYASGLAEFQNWLIESGAIKLFPVIDCTTPDKFNGDASDFIDAAHIGPYNNDRLTEHLILKWKNWESQKNTPPLGNSHPEAYNRASPLMNPTH